MVLGTMPTFNANMVGQNKNFDALATRHRRLGTTYLTNSVGQKLYYTIDPENFDAVYGKCWQGWGVESARAAEPQPFCRRRFITTDSQEWKQIRDSMDSAFNIHNSNLSESFRKAIDEVIRTLPIDGSTIDLQPVLSNFFLDVAGEFLIGKRFKESAGAGTGPPVDATDFLEAFHKGSPWVHFRVFFGSISQCFPNRTFEKYCERLHFYINCYIDDELRKIEQIMSLKTVTRISKIYSPLRAELETRR
ncbi:hypothetical protein B0J11DRAFT_500935 [Dendryphion nanum]|uniref:Cytochrome P450 n=1 Tax=Dendryphion nanum TaxID=256645 RepID=A0A9P9EJC1_9PLEO|nr:hypothetical protein B0J11DRAFT_500935 [Dendryphion nanum]